MTVSATDQSASDRASDRAGRELLLEVLDEIVAGVVSLRDAVRELAHASSDVRISGGGQGALTPTTKALREAHAALARAVRLRRAIEEL